MKVNCKTIKREMGKFVQLNSIKVIPRSISSSSTSSTPSSSNIIEEANPREAWLPLTASRNGNMFYSAFQILNSGIGIQALSIPVAFTVIGWTWGIICLSLVFAWKLYTTWLLIQLHESTPGKRYSRYLHLSMAAFGEKLGKLLTLFPVMYLSGGTCVILVITAGSSMKLFFEIICHNCNWKPLTVIEWNLVFVILAVIIAQLHPNLNSVAVISLIGAITAFTYCTLVWVSSITMNRPTDISYNTEKATSCIGGVLKKFIALGIIALAFRGHNLVLEIQGTMASSEEHPSRVPMWRAAKFAYLLIASCLFPLAIALYWVYGNKIENANGRMLIVLHQIHRHDGTEKLVLGLTSLLTVVACLCSFQIYAMIAFDNLEFAYVNRKNQPCPQWVRSLIRIFFGCVVFFIAVAFPFLVSLGGLVGGIALPVTFSYPSFMWIAIKKPTRYNGMWCLNWALGCLGMVLSLLVFVGGIWNLVDPGVYFRFFKP